MRRPALLLCAAAMLTACGTTVPYGAIQRQDTDGLSPAPNASQRDVASADGQGGTGDGAPGLADAAVGASPGATSPQTAIPQDSGSPLSTGAVTGPLRLGFVVEKGSGGDANAKAGVVAGNTLTVGSITRALVDSFNAHGGIAGRRIEPVYYEMDATTADYATANQAACAQFTQDGHVAAVLGLESLFDQGYEACLQRGGALHVRADTFGADDLSLSTLPGLVQAGGPSLDRRGRGIVQVLGRDGSLARGQKLGVLVEGCPSTVRAFDAGLAPAARSSGISIIRVDVRCASGFSDVAGLAADVQSAVLRFRQAQVDRVMFLGNAEATGILLFAQAAESQEYRPKYALTSAAQPALLAANVPAGQLAGMRGIGWLPALDVSVSALPARDKQQTRCLTILRSRGLAPQSSADLYFAYGMCDAFFLYERILTETRGASDLQRVITAARQLGTSYSSALTLGQRFGPERLDGPALVRVFQYNAGCKCFAYVRPATTLP